MPRNGCFNCVVAGDAMSAPRAVDSIQPPATNSQKRSLEPCFGVYPGVSVSCNA